VGVFDQEIEFRRYPEMSFDPFGNDRAMIRHRFQQALVWITL